MWEAQVWKVQVVAVAVLREDQEYTPDESEVYPQDPGFPIDLPRSAAAREEWACGSAAGFLHHSG